MKEKRHPGRLLSGRIAGAWRHKGFLGQLVQRSAPYKQAGMHTMQKAIKFRSRENRATTPKLSITCTRWQHVIVSRIIQRMANAIRCKTALLATRQS